MTLRLALSRAMLGRASHRRSEAGLVPRLLADPGTAVLLLDGDWAPVRDGPTRLALVDPGTAARLSTGAEVAAFLGEDAAGRGYVLLAGPGTARDTWSAPARSGDDTGPPANDDARRGADHGENVSGPDVSGPNAGGASDEGRDDEGKDGAPDGGDAARPAPDGARWADLRAVGHYLDDADAGIMTSAVALANWHGRHPRCSRCGADTEPAQAGWARACPVCGTEHFPRTDPAVIMSVVDGADRILLGRHAGWPEKRFSTLAGFVEPGESLEAAVRREVAEEAGVLVGDVHYRGSQPWPFPLSLMLGFRAHALHTEITVDGQELTQARWWTREELALDLATDELVLPPAMSIARQLIEDWYGGPLTDGGGVWR